MARKMRLMIQLDAEEMAWLDAQARMADWSRAKYLGKLIRQAKAASLDLTSGQAQGLADFMKAQA